MSGIDSAAKNYSNVGAITSRSLQASRGAQATEASPNRLLANAGASREKLEAASGLQHNSLTLGATSARQAYRGPPCGLVHEDQP